MLSFGSRYSPVPRPTLPRLPSPLPLPLTLLLFLLVPSLTARHQAMESYDVFHSLPIPLNNPLRLTPEVLLFNIGCDETLTCEESSREFPFAQF